MVDENDLPGWITPAVRAALPAALDEARALCAPAMGRDFKRTVTSALVLVAGVGMSQDESRAWQAIAAEALRGIPVDLLELGCATARRTADHPSKIVPTILKTVGRSWDARRADLAKLQRIEAAAELAAPAEPESCSPEAAAAIMAEFGIKPAAPPAPPRSERPEATIADYLALGLSEAEAQQAIEERRRLLARRPNPSFAAAAAKALSATQTQTEGVLI